MAIVTLTMQASDIPVGTRVRKTTGQNLYVLMDKIDVYQTGVKDGEPYRKEIVVEAGTRFLFGEKAINCIPGTMRLSIDFSSPDEACLFLSSMIETGSEQ